MADIEKISLNNTTYSICDKSARDNIPTLLVGETTVSGSVSGSFNVAAFGSILGTNAQYTNGVVTSAGWRTIYTTSLAPTTACFGSAICPDGSVRDCQWLTNGKVNVYAETSDSNKGFTINMIGY